MPRAIRIHETGGPEVLSYDEFDLERPAPDEVQIEHRSIGVNFIDTYHRSGLYPVDDLPSGIGMEAAGVVTAVGEDVDSFEAGDRVCYPKGPPGAYATHRNMPAELVLPLPAAIDGDVAAASMVKGMTVEYLVRRCFEVTSEHTILWHAAAGGVGLIACEWLRDIGATVIGTVSTEEKAERARSRGCDHTIIYTREDFETRVSELTDGAGVDVVYDSVGKTTLEGSLRCLKQRGTCVSFGNASGAPDPVSPLTLSRLGSLYLTRPSLMHYIAERDELEESAHELFSRIERGVLTPDVNHSWTLADAADAHRALEARETSGSIVLHP